MTALAAFALERIARLRHGVALIAGRAHPLVGGAGISEA